MNFLTHVSLIKLLQKQHDTELEKKRCVIIFRLILTIFSRLDTQLDGIVGLWYFIVAVNFQIVHFRQFVCFVVFSTS